MPKEQQRIHIISNEYTTDTQTAADATALDAARVHALVVAHDAATAADHAAATADDPAVAHVVDHAAVHATGDREKQTTKTNLTEWHGGLT